MITSLDNDLWGEDVYAVDAHNVYFVLVQVITNLDNDFWGEDVHNVYFVQVITNLDSDLWGDDVCIVDAHNVHFVLVQVITNLDSDLWGEAVYIVDSNKVYFVLVQVITNLDNDLCEDGSAGHLSAESRKCKALAFLLSSFIMIMMTMMMKERALHFYCVEIMSCLTQAYMHERTHLHTHMRMHIRTHAHTHTHTNVCLHVLSMYFTFWNLVLYTS